MTRKIVTKRAYEKAGTVDGERVLVDRLWPRGVSKADAKIDHWLKDIGPSDDLRKAFHHGDINFDDFDKKYRDELSSGDQKTAFNELKEIVADNKTTVTLVFAAKDEAHNNAIVLKDLLS